MPGTKDSVFEHEVQYPTLGTTLRMLEYSRILSHDFMHYEIYDYT